MFLKKYHASRGILGVNVVVVNNRKTYYLQSAVENFNIDDFDWGCDGGRSECLAKSILADLAGTSIAEKYYKKFVQDFVVHLPIAGFTLHSKAITDWLKENRGVSQSNGRVCH